MKMFLIDEQTLQNTLSYLSNCTPPPGMTTGQIVITVTKLQQLKPIDPITSIDPIALKGKTVEIDE